MKPASHAVSDVETENTNTSIGHSLKSVFSPATKYAVKPAVRVQNTSSRDTNSSDTNSSDIFSHGTFSREKQTIVIGIGTGRCGTLAFSKLLNFQQRSEVSHEIGSCKGLEWTYEKSEVFPELSKRFARSRINQYVTHSTGRRQLLIGDIALWNLPYAEAFLEDERVKIVVLKRNRNDTGWFCDVTKSHENCQKHKFTQNGLKLHFSP